MRSVFRQIGVAVVLIVRMKPEQPNTEEEWLPLWVAEILNAVFYYSAAC